MLGSVEATNLISLSVLIATLAYVFLTWKITRSNRQMVEETQRIFRESRAPVIAINVCVRQSVALTLRIENRGLSPAKNLKLTIDKDFHAFADRTGSRNLRDFNAFSRSISFFDAGEVLEFWLSQGFNLDTTQNGVALTPSKFRVEFQHEYEGRVANGAADIDLGAYFNATYPLTTDEQIGQLVEQMKITNTLLQRGVSGLETARNCA